MYMPSATTVYFPSTSSIGYQQQPPSWASVEPIAPQQPQQQVNDIFTGVSYFNANEKPAIVHKRMNTTLSVMYAQMVQYVPYYGYVQFYAPVAQIYNIEVAQFCSKQLHQVSLGQRSSLPVPVAQPRNMGFDQYIFEKVYSGSLGECSSSSSENLSGCSSPYQHNGTTYFHVPNASPLGHHSPSEFYYNRPSKRELYAMLLKYKASKEELEKNGYPMIKNGEVVVPDTKYTERKKMWRSPNDKMRTCTRCHIDFELKRNGRMSECVFHTKRTVFDQERGYVRECCSEADGLTEGCEMRRFHVFDQLLTTELETFICTEKAYGIHDERSYNIFAIDCEMVYTVSGPALARVSVVNYDGELVLDVMVRPPSMVIDPNTEYSGLTIDDVYTAQDTLDSCRQKLMTLINEKTLLVGHSLESDLKALRLVHPNVIDTSLLYITSKGFKVGLKKLALKHLGRSIQSNNADVVGHDSSEDAQVSMELLKVWIAKNQ